MSAPSLSIRLDLPGGRLGPGKVALLEAIAREGSISAAARSIGMSYRRAWALVEQVNATFGGPAVEASAGGRQGGGAALTPLGRDLVAAYRAIEDAAAAAARAHLAVLSRRWT
jgi:molybdate transport system regulatory protein